MSYASNVSNTNVPGCVISGTSVSGTSTGRPNSDARATEETGVRDAGTLDVSALPTYGFSHRSLMWWGNAGMMLIEGTVFALAVITYFYLRSHADVWPMSRLPPDLLWGTINTLIILGSAWPNHLVKQAADKQQLQRVRLWLVVCLVFSLAFLVIRIFEFRSLNVSWDSNAYGSVVWTLLGLHTAHLLTDTVETMVLTTLMFSDPVAGKSFVDVSEEGIYWYFVVFSWLLIYVVIYLAPRILQSPNLF